LRIAYGCKNGAVGIWDTERPDAKNAKIITTITGDVESLDISKDGHYLVLGGSAGIVTVIDTETTIASIYLGHNGRISAVAAPAADGLLFGSADTNGNVADLDGARSSGACCLHGNLSSHGCTIPHRLDVSRRNQRQCVASFRDV
jgi:WD40 repeat protein